MLMRPETFPQTLTEGEQGWVWAKCFIRRQAKSQIRIVTSVTSFVTTARAIRDAMVS